MLTRQDLIAFEADIAARFERGEIHAPVHLSGGNEDKLIEIFKDIRPEDYVFSTWRSHYHALLKGIPREEVLRQILAGRSMFISSPKHRFFASSIMGGTLPIACGIAATLTKEKVYCFVGDMCASTGVFQDSLKFAIRRELPMLFINEDNGLATNTPTEAAWGDIPTDRRKWKYTTYQYERTYPHYQSRSGQGRGF